MKVVAQTLGVARSQLHVRLSGRGRPRQRYAKPEDRELLPAIRSLVDERPTYGYRRIGACSTGNERSRHCRGSITSASTD